MAYRVLCDLLKPYPPNFRIRSKISSALSLPTPLAIVPLMKSGLNLAITSVVFLLIALISLYALARSIPPSWLKICMTCS